MTAGQSTGRLSSVALAPAPLAAILGATLLAGAAIGAATMAQLNPTEISRGSVSAPGQPGATFDAPKFRAEERGTLVPQPTFDAPKFRAEERGTLVPRSEPNESTSRRGGK
jgi:hypothetical protein